MEASALQNWQQWRDQQQADTGIAIDLWDETKLRELLMQPAAAHVVQAFYHPYRDPQPPAAAQIRLTGGDEDPSHWRDGDELRIDAGSYLLHAPVEQHAASDRSWLWREATAEQIEPEQRRLRHRRAAHPARLGSRAGTAADQPPGAQSEAGGSGGPKGQRRCRWAGGGHDPDPRVVDPISDGWTPMVAAMEAAERAVTTWCAAHQRSFPPIVMNITDGESTDGDPREVAARVRATRVTLDYSRAAARPACR